ncbi:MAG: ATP-binding protein [Methylocystis sp.]|nr:ATP-binding protein [Methylocystis sp.]
MSSDIAHSSPLPAKAIFNRESEAERDDPLGWSNVFKQVRLDLFGTKDVQNVITASHVWLATQCGHIALGLVPTLALCWQVVPRVAPYVADFFSVPNDSFLHKPLYVVAGLIVWLIWFWKEKRDLDRVSQDFGGVFPKNSLDLWWNVKTAMIYFGIGCALGVAAYLGLWWFVPIFVASALIAFVIAKWWLPRKVAFQQAGLPYLYRLANFTSRLDERALQTISDFANLQDQETALLATAMLRTKPVRREPEIRHLIVTGPRGAGKSALCVGVGTEFAFQLGIGRYTNATQFMDTILAQTKKDEGSHDRNKSPNTDFNDGRTLWKWEMCDLIIVDDIDTGVRRATEPGAATAMLNPANFAQMMRSTRAQPLNWLKGRRSIWVLGEHSNVRAWKNTLASLIGVQETEIGEVVLEGKLKRPDEEGKGLGRLVRWSA